MKHQPIPSSYQCTAEGPCTHSAQPHSTANEPSACYNPPPPIEVPTLASRSNDSVLRRRATSPKSMSRGLETQPPTPQGCVVRTSTLRQEDTAYAYEHQALSAWRLARIPRGPPRHRLDPPGALPGAFFPPKNMGALVLTWEHWYGLTRDHWCGHGRFGSSCG